MDEEQDLAVEKHYSPEQIAELVDVDVSTVYRWFDEGKIKTARKLGRRILRAPASAVNAFLESRTV